MWSKKTLEEKGEIKERKHGQKPMIQRTRFILGFLIITVILVSCLYYEKILEKPLSQQLSERLASYFFLKFADKNLVIRNLTSYGFKI